MYSKGPPAYILPRPPPDPPPPADASDIVTFSTYITYSNYRDLILLIDASTTRHAGLKTLSLLITTQYSAWEWYSYVLLLSLRVTLPIRTQPHIDLCRHSDPSLLSHFRHPSHPSRPHGTCRTT